MNVREIQAMKTILTADWTVGGLLRDSGYSNEMLADVFDAAVRLQSFLDAVEEHEIEFSGSPRCPVESHEDKPDEHGDYPEYAYETTVWGLDGPGVGVNGYGNDPVEAVEHGVKVLHERKAEKQ